MNIISHKTILQVLIIAAELNFIVPWPMFLYTKDLQSSDLPEKRFSRQVVQPSWLNLGPEPAVDPTVHVSRKALLEAEEIRKTIQKAVKEDTFAVTAEELYPNGTNEFEEKSTIHSMHGSSNWYNQLQQFWHKWAQSLFKGFPS